MSRPKGKSSGENATFPILEQYLRYMQAVQEKSPLTIKEYKYDLILLFHPTSLHDAILVHVVPVSINLIPACSHLST